MEKKNRKKYKIVKYKTIQNIKIYSPKETSSRLCDRTGVSMRNA